MPANLQGKHLVSIEKEKNFLKSSGTLEQYPWPSRPLYNEQYDHLFKKLDKHLELATAVPHLLEVWEEINRKDALSFEFSNEEETGQSLGIHMNTSSIS